MDLPTYFDEFLRHIRPSDTQRERMIAAHSDLRERLDKDARLKEYLIWNFIQGSYRRNTGLCGTAQNPCDVDLVVVTNVKSVSSPAAALDLFKPFLEANYRNKFEAQGRSWCINWSDEITLDLVPTSAPSEANQFLKEAFAADFNFSEPVFNRSLKSFSAEDQMLRKFAMLAESTREKWKAEPLEIPDRDARVWEKTHPVAQIDWTTQKNARCNGHYVNVVRAIKWWRRTNACTPKYPKGYPLEHLIGQCCPDGIDTVAEGIARTLACIVDRFEWCALTGTKPMLNDHGVSQDVMKRVSAEDFAGFMQHAKRAAQMAVQACDAGDARKSALMWRQLLGDAFPRPPEENGASPARGGLLKPAAAPAGLAFPNRPIVPQKPAGFAVGSHGT